MALFTDSDIVTLDNLLQFESSLVQVSSTHGIDVETKIRLAIDEIGDRIMLALLQADVPGRWDGRSELSLSNVVVNSSIYRWLCFNSLARVYSEAYNVQLNTRFQGKWVEYQQQANQATNLVMASGVGVVRDPLPKPRLPSISASQGGTGASTLFVQASWTGSNGLEGAAGPIAGAVLHQVANTEVSLEHSLTSVPAYVRGWNVYASTTQTGLTLQTEVPLNVHASWHLPMSGLIVGREPTEGQNPDLNISFSRRLQRG